MKAQRPLLMSLRIYTDPESLRILLKQGAGWESVSGLLQTALSSLAMLMLFHLYQAFQ